MPSTWGGIAYPGGPLEILVNNTKWSGKGPMDETRTDFTAITIGGETAYYSELPVEGTTEVWEIINLTADAHPIHTHLTQFQILNRQKFDVKKYTAAYALAFPGGGMDPMTGTAYPAGVYMPSYGPPLNYNTVNADGAVGGNPAVSLYLKGVAALPLANEAGWKDTIMALPGQVTRIVVRYAPNFKFVNALDLYYDFDPSGGLVSGLPSFGYVWHCHIIDHEDNEMMRPLAVWPKAGATRAYLQGVHY
jgi:FtsP/CotA-like multicopper oxidase with cupredoxin domain